jgi:two-component system, sensor histidine kinase and response regulator
MMSSPPDNSPKKPATGAAAPKVDLLAFRAAVEQSPTTVVITDLDAKITYVNPAFTKITGYTAEEALGQNPRLLKSGEHPEEFYREMWKTLLAGNPWEGTFRNRRKDGALYWEFATIAPVFDAQKRATGYIAVKQDITTQMTLQQQLEAALGEERRHSRFISDLTASLPVAIFRKDLDGRILDVNPATEALTGYSREELLCVPSKECGESQMRILTDDEDRALLAREKDIIRAERHVFHKLGRKVPVIITKAPLHDENERIIGLVAALVDITGIKNLEADLRKAKVEADAANRAKSAFLATMSHEIRTPLNAVIGMASLLAESEMDSQQQEYAHTIVTASETLLDLISDILDYSKIESRKLHLHEEPFEFEDVFLEPVELFQRPAEQKNIEIVHMIDPSVPPVLVGDPMRIKQILINLLSNAVKFTEQGQITLTARLAKIEDTKCLLAFVVRDTGIGIDPEAQKRLFRPFSQADSSITRQFGGSGLGLAIVRQLVELMGGRIHVCSQPGEGSEFRFSVQLEVGEMRAEAAAPEDALKGRRLLVIDDTAVNRQLLVSFGTKWGLKVGEAGGADEARSAIASGQRFDCVIFDYQMPGTDGVTLALELRDTLEAAGTRRILLTSVSDLPHDLPGGLFDKILHKPLRPSRLRAHLAEFFEVSHADSSDGMPAPDSFEGMRLLVAEDNKSNRNVLRLIFRKCGCDTALVENGELAVEQATAHHFDAIFLDMQMPVMDGLTAVARLRRHFAPHDRRPYFVALTANAFVEDEKACLAAGFDEYLVKPAGIEQLRQALGRARAFATGA